MEPVLSACGLIITATPAAIIVWMVMSRRRDPQAAIRRGWIQLLQWVVYGVGGFLLLAFASGGHRASPPIQLLGIVWMLAFTGICVRMLWILYRKIGLPQRAP